MGMVPFGENPERSRKGVYRISDNCFRFWYRYVFMNRTGVESGIGEELADSQVFPGLPAFVGKPAFEEICMQYLIRRNKEKALPFLATNFGVWWGTDPTAKANADIDIVADNKAERRILMCECKWKNEATEAADLEKLCAKAHLIPGYEDYRFMFFSKSPYSASARRMAQENGRLDLATLDMLFDI